MKNEKTRAIETFISLTEKGFSRKVAFAQLGETFGLNDYDSIFAVASLSSSCEELKEVAERSASFWALLIKVCMKLNKLDLCFSTFIVDGSKFVGAADYISAAWLTMSKADKIALTYHIFKSGNRGLIRGLLYCNMSSISAELPRQQQAAIAVRQYNAFVGEDRDGIEKLIALWLLEGITPSKIHQYFEAGATLVGACHYFNSRKAYAIAKKSQHLHSPEISAQNETIYYFQGHDYSYASKSDKPHFEKMTVRQYNNRFETDHSDAQSIIDTDPEYAFTQEEVKNWDSE